MILAVKCDTQTIYRVREDGVVEVLTDNDWETIDNPDDLLRDWADVEVRWAKMIKEG